VDAPLTLACALAVEEKAAREGGARTARVGLGAGLPLPEGPLVSFGFCGALVPGFEPGTLLSAERVVAPDGEVLWAGEPLDVPGALRGVICAADGVADESGMRRALAETSGAVAVDMESGVLAGSGRLAGVVRAVSDGTGTPVGRLVRAGKADGSTDWRVVAEAFALEPRRSMRTALGARRALRTLERAAEALA
jgi:adenosylhomocysteine nucleosidase